MRRLGVWPWQPPSHRSAGFVNAAEIKRQRLALGTGLGLILVWASGLTLQKEVFAAMSAGGFLLARYLLLPVCAALLLCGRHGRRWPRLSAGQWRQMLLAAFIGQVLHVSLVTYGMHQSTAFSSALIMACAPVFTLLILWLAGQERLDARHWIGVLTAMLGVLVFLSDKLLRSDLSGSLGDLMLLLSALLFSIYSVLAKPLFEKHGSLETMCYTIMLAAPMVVVLNLSSLNQVAWSHLPPIIWLGFAWSCLVLMLLGWMLWGWVGVVRGVGRTAPLMYLLPPVAGVFAWLFADEVFGAAKLLGAGLALAGVAFSQLTIKEKRF